MDTHLLKIRGNRDGQERRAEKFVSKGNASVGLGNMPSIPIVVYSSRALIIAEFREMSSDDFKDRYLAPLDKALKESNICNPLLARNMLTHWEMQCIWNKLSKNYFNEISIPIKGLYHDVGDRTTILAIYRL